MLFSNFLAMAFAAFASAAPWPSNDIALASRQTADGLVFCHFMIGIVGDRTSAADYDSDMIRAKSLGIDAFALNIGVDPYTDTQLNYAYQSAATNGMKVFISFDFNWYNTGQATTVGQKIAQYGSLPAQLKVDGKIFASSFAGDGLDVAALRAAAGAPVFFVPNFHPGQASFDALDGAFNWMAWPNNGNNKAATPSANISVEAGDVAYATSLAGKSYMAPVSPWFSTHFGPEVSYSKNWVFPSDLLWFQRWEEILTLKPRFVEIITWNDYGESHYIGPLDSKHYDDGNSKWVNDMPHGGWMDMARPFISAYKAGASSPDQYITSDQLIYWYRPNPRDLNCDSTDTTMQPANNGSGNYFQGRPDGWESMSDSVFVVSLLTSPGIVTVMSGLNTQQFSAPAGASEFEVPMDIGSQQFFLQRDGKTVLSAVSLRDITDTCPCGIYNFNAYVGTVPDSPVDQLQADGLASLTAGLHVSTCRATPSLATETRKPTVTPGSGPVTTTTTSTSTSTATTSTTTSNTTPITTPPVTTPPTSTSTSTSSSTSSSTSTAPTSTQSCTAGYGSGNYIGLCSFCCQYGYCPPGPCTCTAWGIPAQEPPTTGQKGVPLPGEDDSYLGLCSYACNHNYCPPTACMLA